MLNTFPNSALLKLGRRPWQVMLLGFLLATAVTVLLMVYVMQAPFAEISSLLSTLSLTSLFSLGAGYFLYRRGWARLASLRLTLVMTYIWAAVLTLVNVWVLSLRMFANTHDLILSGILLLFSGIIATAFGIFVASSVSDSLRQLSQSAAQIAEGDLSARAVISGQDEVAQVGETFNRMAQQLQETARQREELERLRVDLIAWTSHDLRTPLTSIRAMIEALHDGLVDDPETIQRYYRTIRADIISLNGLLDDLFELAQLDAGGMQFEMSTHSLRDLISDTLESLQALAQQRDISLAGEVATGLDSVVINAAKIGRVLSNLITNAIRHTPVGGSIDLRASRNSEGMVIEVVDSGPGFAEKDLARIFEQFYRGGEARSRATGGAGLGLAIARGIVEAHNGRIWAKNGPDGGAIVGFLLPDA